MKPLVFFCNQVNSSNHSGRPEDFRRTANFQIVPDAPENKEFFGADIAEAGFAVSTKTSEAVHQFEAGKRYRFDFTAVEIPAPAAPAPEAGA